MSFNFVSFARDYSLPHLANTLARKILSKAPGWENVER